MRQVVVLKPAGSVLVMRQTSINQTANITTNNTNNIRYNDNHLNNNTLNDHNQNRIVVVRSSSTSCMTTQVSCHIFFSSQ